MELDKRPWLMDALLEIGQDMAILTHTREKTQYLKAELNKLESSDQAGIIVDRISALEEIRKNTYASYDTKMSFITQQPDSKDGRCLLKHASAKLTFAMELDDALDNPMSEDNLNLAFQVFAGAVSFVLGVEFHSCLRCIYDGMNAVSKELAGDTSVMGLVKTELAQNSDEVVIPATNRKMYDSYTGEEIPELKPVDPKTEAKD